MIYTRKPFWPITLATKIAGLFGKDDAFVMWLIAGAGAELARMGNARPLTAQEAEEMTRRAV